MNDSKRNQCRQHHRTESQLTRRGDMGLIIANLANVKNENQWEKPQRKEKKIGGKSQRKGRIIAGGGGPSGRIDENQMVTEAADGRAGRRGAGRSHLSRKLWIWPTYSPCLRAHGPHGIRLPLDSVALRMWRVPAQEYLLSSLGASLVSGSCPPCCIY